MGSSGEGMKEDEKERKKIDHDGGRAAANWTAQIRVREAGCARYARCNLACRGQVVD